MKKNILLFTVILISFTSYSQILFENGYFITNDGKRTNCLIKNLDWKNNPTDFKYKISKNSDVQKNTINNIKEFGVNNLKFIRSSVQIDRSSDNISSLSDIKAPAFKEEKLFLKILIEGKASLYFYQDDDLKRFFYSKDTIGINQLVYKIYVIEDSKIRKNTDFRKQLWENFKCDSLTLKNYNSLEYNKKDLIAFFINHNSCHSNEIINYTLTEKRDLFNLNLRPRINNSNLKIVPPYNANIDLGSKLHFGFGLEAEFIFSFNKNKWSIIMEPTYQNFNLENLDNGDSIGKTVNYQSIEVPVGLRHYFFLNEKSKVFANVSYVFDFSLDSYILYSNSPAKREISTTNNLALGIGYKYNDKYSIELRYQTRRDLLNSYVFWVSDYNTLSVIFGYTLF